ncbi:phosphate/phosphite/phosphonate ABC transporter substrate-binding protein [Lactobacillus johnsonii]|uniref:phosphate/phosphite/phosphonate ABC transporter substrate-binding protein n=1 Tax=Lactobacillus johnsonii TaxID=33959 RepID=UPI0028E69187|nr:phosphate/phosphite/phosphonate ABC transporter substrate-binding protein [Lactobacillus johnsonii]MDT9605708.1 phosphate/phosphite/phosphonate ABC transporter substrate-binding protein [Lactobacillus johnsonii]
MRFKKIITTSLLLLGAMGLTACSNNSEKSANTYTPKELNVQFVPSVQANKIEAKAKPLAKLLSKKLGIPVHVTVSTDNTALVESMASKKVDVGFLPSDAYVLAHKRKAADPLLQAMRYDYDEPSGKQNPNKLDSKYQSMIIVRKNSKIKSIKDLKGKKIAIQDPTSTSGYILPVAELYKKGINVVKDDNLVNVKGHDQGVVSVLNGDTDAAFVFKDARNLVAKDEPNVFKEVKPIYFTKKVPNDTISVRSDMSSAFRKKLAKSMKEIVKTKEGAKILKNIYDHYGYKDAKDSDYNIIREYQSLAKKAQESK